MKPRVASTASLAFASLPVEDWIHAVDCLASCCDQASLTRGAHLPKRVIPLSRE